MSLGLTRILKNIVIVLLHDWSTFLQTILQRQLVFQLGFANFPQRSIQRLGRRGPLPTIQRTRITPPWRSTGRIMETRENQSSETCIMESTLENVQERYPATRSCDICHRSNQVSELTSICNSS